MGKNKKTLLLIGFLVMLIIPSKSYSSVNAASAGNLTSGVGVTKTIKSYEEHSYTFTTNKDGEIYLTLDKTSGGMFVNLKNADGESIEYSHIRSGGRNTTINKKVLKGTYTVYIKPYDWDGMLKSKYSLKVTYPGKIIRNKKSFEPNDTFETAYPLTNGKITNSKLESNPDVDKYKFTTNKDGEIYITLDGSSAGVFLTLYDANGDVKGIDYFKTGGETARIRLKDIKGTYYIKVRSNNWNGVSSSKYRLKATFAASFKRGANLESNDTMETAYPMISGKSYSSTSFSLFDSDMFKFTTSKNGKVTVKLDKNNDGYYLYLYDFYGTNIKTEYISRGGSTVNVEEILKKGTYFVRVEPYDWDGKITSNYRIRASFQNKTPKVNAVSNASTTIKGSAETSAKVYAYVGKKLIGSTTASSGKYTIKIAKQKAKVKIAVHIVDKSGVKSASRTVTVADKIAPIKPTVAKVTTKSIYVSGKTEASAKVYIYNGKKNVATGTANSKGSYKIKIAKQKKGSTIKVYALDAAKNKSQTASVKVN